MGVPGFGDAVTFTAGANVTFTSNVPTALQSITVNGGGAFVEFNDAAAPTLTLTFASSVGGGSLLTLRRGTFILDGSTLTINGTIQVNANPSVTFVATNAATVFVATGGALQTANGGDIQISTGSLLDVQAAAPFGVTNNTGVGGTLTLGINSTLLIRPGARVQNNAPGVLTVNSGCTIDIQGDGNFIGTAPAYIAGSNLTYTSTPAKTVGAEIPTGVPMNANITVNNAGGVTLGAGVTYQLYGGMTISPGRVLAFNNLTILDLFAGSYCWSGSFQGNNSASLRFMGVVTQLCADITFVAPQQLNTLQLIATGMGLGSNLTVSGALTVSAGQLGIATGAMLTLQGGGTVTPANGIDVLAGGTLNIDGASPLGVAPGSVRYSNAGATLLYTGGGSFVAGLEFPALNGPTNLTINKTAGTAVTLPGTRAIPLAPTPGVLTLTSGELRTAGFQMQVLNNALGAVAGGSANSYVSIGAGGAFQRAIQAGGATWNFPVGNITTGYMPLALLSPSGNATVTASVVTNALASGANGMTTILNPMQDPRWNIVPSAPITAIVEAGFTGVTGTNKIGISATDAMNSYDGIGGATPDVFTMLVPPILRSVAAATLPIAGSFIRIGNGLPTTYFYCPTCGIDPTIAANWRDNGLPGGIAAPGFFAGYTFRIPSGVTATYSASWNVPAMLTYQVDNGGTLEFDGDVNFTGNNIIYQSNLATLRYINGGGGGTGVELPNAPTPMVGTVVINRTNGSNFNINNGKIFNGAVTISSGIVNTTAVNHTFNAAPTALTVNGNGWFYVNTGAVTLTENAILNAAGRITLQGATPLSIAAGRTLAVSGTGILELVEFMGNHPQISGLGVATFTPSATLRFTNGWNGTVNLNTLPTPFDGTLDIVNGSPTLAVDRTLQGNISIATGALNVGMNVALTLAGAGTITTTGGNRIDAETQAGAGIISQRATLNGNWFTNNRVNNFTLDGNATLTNDLTVISNLGFTNGLLTTTVNNELIAGQSLAITGANATRFVNGPMQTTFPTPGVGMTRALPVGKNATYLPVELRSVTTVAGLNPRVRVEAFDTAPAGGTFPLAPIGNEHWLIETVANPLVMTQYQIALGRAAMLFPASRQVSKAAPVSGTYVDAGNTPTMLPPYSGIQGNVFFGFPNAYFALTGAPPSTFYYQTGGNADLTTSWNSNIAGGGSQPSNFTTAGTNFYVPSGRTATFTMPTTFGIGTILQVESGGAITVPNAQTLTANGSLRVNGGGRLTLQGTGNVVAPSGVQYLAPTALLEYNAPSNRLTTSTEFPDVMPAQIEIHSGSVRLNASKHLQSTLLLNNSTLTFGAANRLRLSNAVTFLGASTNFATDASDTLIIDGAGTLAGSVFVPELARLTMNRGGLPFNINGTTRITQQLGLFGGNVAMQANESLILQSSADTALVGGNASSFVSGTLVRLFRANETPMTAQNVFFPIGRNTTYLPLTLTESTTGSVAPFVGAEAQLGAAGGTPALGVPGALSTSEFWRVVRVSGDFTGARVGVLRGGLTAMNSLAFSTTRTGLYASLGGALTALPQGNSLLGQAANNAGERFYAIVGTLPSSPRVTGFSPGIGGEGTVMTITGTNLTGVNSVAVGGVSVRSFTVLSSTTISVVLGPVSSGPIQIGSPLGGAASDSSFTFVPMPVLGGISPNPAGVGTVITIGGTFTGGVNGLVIGGVGIPLQNITVNQNGSISVQIPANATTSTIILSTPGGTVISTSALSFVGSPRLLSFSPLVAATGAIVTITGENFVQGMTLLFGTVPAQALTVNSPTRISAIVPAQAIPTFAAALASSISEKGGATLQSTWVQSVFLTARTGGGTATSATQFVYSPTLTGGQSGIDPARLVVVSRALDTLVPLGARVRVTGANMELINDLTLRTSIGSIRASYSLSSSGQISIIIPQTGLLRSTNASLSRALVTVDALGVNNRAIATNLFSIVGAPLIRSITPPNAGVGEEVRVQGDNLDLILAAGIGGTNATFRLSNGDIFVRIPGDVRTGGLLPVGGALVFTSVGGIITTSAQIINAAFASGAPFIAGFSPTSGGAGTQIVVTGANFSVVTDASVGGIPVASFVINSSTRMTITLAGDIPLSSTGVITLLGAFGQVNSLREITFPVSLAGERLALEQALAALGLNTQDVITQFEGNRVASLETRPGAQFNTNLAAFIDRIATLTALRNLNLSNSGLTGAIPPSLARLTRLESLNLSGNTLTGELLPGILCVYPNLRLLNLRGNRLEGEIPVCLTGLTNLQDLDLSNNRFRGRIPKEFGAMPNLAAFNVSNNRLSGGLPPEFGTPEGAQPLTGNQKTALLQSASTLVFFDASGNELTGTIPAEWGGIRNLQHLNLSRNRLTGRLPASIVHWESLETLLLSDNRFDGVIPAMNGNRLITLWLQNNRFSGALPQELSRAGRLRVLRAEGNQFEQLPVAPSRIDTIRVDSNRLEFGSLENGIGARVFTFAQQDSLGRGGDTIVRAGSRFTLASGIGGTGTVYQWLRNGVAIPGATAHNLTFQRMQVFQSGTYICRATNSRFPNLTGVTRSLMVAVTGANSIIAAPTLTFPPVNGENIAVRPRFLWSSVEGAEQYEIVIARDAAMRDVVLRRVVSSAAQPAYRMSMTDAALERGWQYFWRVRGLAVGSEGENSAVSAFRVVPLGVDIGFSTIDVGRGLVGSGIEGDGALVNVGMGAVTLDSARAENTAAFRILSNTLNATLQPNQELPVSARFTPLTAGEVTANVRVWYKDAQQQSRQVAFQNVLRGRGSALRVDELDFEAVRVGRTALKAVRIINVSTEPLVLRSLRIALEGTSDVARESASLFSIDALLRDTLFAGDTLFTTVRCRSVREINALARIEARWTAGGLADSTFSRLTAQVRLVNPDNPFVVLSVRPKVSGVAPGTAVPLEIFIAEGDTKAISEAALPEVRVRVAFDRNVLSLTGGARLQRSRENARTQEVEFSTLWNERQSGRVIGVFDTRAVAGDIDTTALRIVGIEWGKQGVERQEWERGVVVEEPQDGRFAVRTSAAGGKRLIGNTGNNLPKNVVIASLQPNPARNEEVTIDFTMQQESTVEAVLVSVNGEEVRRIALGNKARGEHSVTIQLGNLASGAYRVVLKTPRDNDSALLNVVR
jgi:Leucine-rich repeat (LRR) protein